MKQYQYEFSMHSIRWIESNSNIHDWNKLFIQIPHLSILDFSNFREFCDTNIGKVLIKIVWKLFELSEWCKKNNKYCSIYIH